MGSAEVLAIALGAIGAVTGILGAVASIVSNYIAAKALRQAQAFRDDDQHRLQLQAAWELHERYTKEHIDAMSTVSSYKRKHQARYYAAFSEALESTTGDDDASRVNSARRLLASFWDWATELAKDEALPAKVFAKGRLWLSRGDNYRKLLEPVDIANYYHGGFINIGDSGHYLERDNRPERYKYLEDMHREAYRGTTEPTVSSTSHALDEQQKSLV
eukprot:jgi/Chlat1/627/Chrsp103S00004